MTVALYITAFVVANVVTAATAPLDAGPFLITWGTFVVGATFVLRDLVQIRHGRAVAYEAIFGALALSALTSAMLGDTLAVVAGSAAAVLIGETLDTEVFTRLPAGLPTRIAISGIVGGTLDSAAFVLIGLSPLWSGIIPWDAVPNAILGVALVKAAMQLAAGALARWALTGPEPEPEPATLRAQINADLGL